MVHKKTVFNECSCLESYIYLNMKLRNKVIRELEKIFT